MRKRNTSKGDVIKHWLGVLIFSVVVGGGMAVVGIYGILKEAEKNKFYIVGENHDYR